DLNLPASHREAVVNSMVYIHFSLHRFNRKLLKQQNKTTFLTPRHFLDFVAQYVKLFNEKREDLEEQQRHLNIGLEKLRDTVIKVDELRKSLAIKNKELADKNEQANTKLNIMVKDHQDAEAKKDASKDIQAALEVQTREIEDRKSKVLDNLKDVEPMLLEAQRSVQGIKKAQLTEVRSMANPPEAVKLAMTSVCVLLGQPSDSWKAVQAL